MIVDELGATVHLLSHQEEFIGFNCQTIFTSQKTTLWFKNSGGGSAHKANFLASPVTEIPFDMLLGARDCLKFNILRRPNY